jgi:transcriptional regulator with XRE-family HTH domain
MTIGERIAKCRKEKKLSQEYIAENLEVSRQAVSKLERDEGYPSIETLKDLAKLI